MMPNHKRSSFPLRRSHTHKCDFISVSPMSQIASRVPGKYRHPTWHMILESSTSDSVKNSGTICPRLHLLTLHWEGPVCWLIPITRHFAVHHLVAWNVILPRRASMHKLLMNRQSAPH